MCNSIPCSVWWCVIALSGCFFVGSPLRANSDLSWGFKPCQKIPLRAPSSHPASAASGRNLMEYFAMVSFPCDIWNSRWVMVPCVWGSLNTNLKSCNKPSSVREARGCLEFSACAQARVLPLSKPTMYKMRCLLLGSVLLAVDSQEDPQFLQQRTPV